jgi:hypothetical protein
MGFSKKRSSLVKWAGVAGVALASGLASQAFAQTVLVKDGKAAASIVLPAEPSKDEALAAQEIQTHLEMMSGAKLPIIKKGEAVTGVPIYIGNTGESYSEEKLKAKSKDPYTLRVLVTPKAVELSGNSEDGTLSAAYELLEQLGVRWYYPGPLGQDVPSAKTVIAKEQDYLDAPGYRGRILQAVGQKEWEARMRLGGFGAGAHGLGPEFDREKEPNLFNQEKGKATGQEKVSEPEVLRRTIAHWREKLKQNPNMEVVNVGPHDGAGFGNDPWDADDFDPIMGKVATTDRYVKFFNLILEDLQKDYPNVGLAFYAYTQEMRPPVRETPNKKILPMLAAIGLDRFHSINNPLSWEKKYLKTVVEGWQAKGVNMMFRGYLFNLADQGLPFSMIDIVKEEWPYYYDKGFIAMRAECIVNWAYHGPALYLAAKLYWNPKADSKAIMDEYFTRLYGPAGKAMKEHFDIVENAYIHADYYTGNVFDIPKILTPKVRAEMERTLKAAEAAAKGDKKYEDRVAMIRLGFEYGEANLNMMDAFNHAKFAEAKKYHDRALNELIPASSKHVPIVISGSNFAYFKRFWSRGVENAALRVQDGREIASVLPDEWVTFLDPYNAGEKLFLQDPQNGTQSWRPMKTWSDSSSNQGLRYYKASIWYRCNLNVPKRFDGRKLRFWMGGVDDTPRVWIDGKELPLFSKGAAPIGVPWEFDATGFVVPGKEQVVVVKVSDSFVNELGTVGITGPVMVWAESASGPNLAPVAPTPKPVKPAPKPKEPVKKEDVKKEEVKKDKPVEDKNHM